MIAIYLILIFIAPGLIYEALKEGLRLKKEDRSKENIYKQMFSVVGNSVIISAIVIIVLLLTKKIPPFDKFEELLHEMDSVFITGKIAGGIVVTSVVWFVFNDLAISKIVLFVKKKYCLIKYNVEPNDLENYTVWETIMLHQPKNDRKPFIKICKEEKMVAAGILNDFCLGDFSVAQITLYGEETAKRIIDADKTKQEKILDKVLYSFFDNNTGYKVEFYDTEKLYEHWDEYVNKS